ncbi:MAG: beta-ketoacyl synthase chain length factor [Usitatibacter sp.]
MKLAARIEGVGIVGPGIANWKDAREILAGRTPFVSRPTVLASPEGLPATERRRAGKSVRLSLAAGLEACAEAGHDARDLVAIFTSSSGDGENCHAICEALASDDRMISPTRFHNSVHNAPAGYWGIATGSTHATDCLAAFDASFGAGLVEAFGRLAAQPSQPVLLIAYDAPYPEPLHATRPIPDCFGVAFAFACDSRSARGPKVTFESTHDRASVLADAPLEALRISIPAARALPLLSLLARGESGRVVIEYLDGLALAVEVEQ